MIESNILEEKYDFIAREIQSGGSGQSDSFLQQQSPLPISGKGEEVPIEDPEAKAMWLKCVGAKVSKLINSHQTIFSIHFLYF